ncbi:MAG: pre-peptidase C-terminal domain-containing protein [Aggregatilineales bacterium]
MMQARRLLVAMTLLMLIVAVFGVQAQTDGTPIAPGDSVTATLSEDSPRALYTFSVETSTPTTITLESRDFDSYLLLLDEDGEIVSEDDDSAGRLNSRIETTLDAGDYTIVATSLREYRSEGELFSTGDFSLTFAVTGAQAQATEVSASATPRATTTADASTMTGDALSYGDVVEGTLSEDMPRAEYTFAAEAGDYVTLTLEADGFDAYLILLDAAGEQITTDDDGAGGLNSRISNFELVAGGDYTVIATSFGDAQGFTAGFGDYVLTIEQGEFTPTPTPTIIPSLTPLPTATPLAQGVEQGGLEFGDTASINFSGFDSAHTFGFNASAGDIINVELTSPDFDTYLILYDSNGEELLRDDDGGEGLNSFIFEYEIPADDVYTIYVTSYGSISSNTPPLGDYTVTLTEGAFVVETTPVPTFTPTASPITSGLSQGAILAGQTESGTLTEDEPAHEYTLSASAGDIVSISLVGDSIDTYLMLLNDDGEEISVDDDGGDGLNSLIANFEIPADGDYTIVATTYGAARGFVPGYGDYDLSVESGTITAQSVTPTPVAPTFVPSPSPTFGPSVTPSPVPTSASSSTTIGVPQGEIALNTTVDGTLTLDAPAHAYTFSANSGDVVNIALESSQFDSYLLLLDSAGNQVTFNDDGGGGLDSLIASFIIPSSGEYTIVASSYGNVRGFDAGTGDYTLALNAGSAIEVTVTPAPPQGTPTFVPTFTPTPADSGNTIDEVVQMGVIVPGTVNGQLGDGFGQAHEYTFNGTAGDLVTITLTSEDFDTYLFVFYDGDTVGVNDDADDISLGLNSQIVDLELAFTGEYTIGVSSYDWVQIDTNVSGSYTLDFITTGDAVVNVPSATPTAIVTPTATAIAPTAMPTNEVYIGTLFYGDSISNSLTEGATGHVFTFSGVGGDLVTISQTSDTLDSYLILRDANGNEIITNDDGGDGLNSLIEDFELPFSGEYIIVASTFGAVRGSIPGIGDYTLTLNSSSSEFVGEPTEIVVGDVVDAELVRNQPYQDYRLFAQAGDQIVITLTSFDFDTYLLLFDDNGVELTRDDDSAGDLDSRIGPFEIPADGMYTIQVNSFSNVFDNGIVGGAYTLRVEVIAPQPIEYTQSIESALTQTESLGIYTFEGEAGDIVTVNLTADSSSVYARLTGANGQIDIQSYGGGQPIGPVTLSQDGTYFITVASYETGFDQNYTILLDRIVPVEVVYGDEIDTNFDDTLAHYYSFEAEEGDSLNMSVVSEGSVDTTLRLIGPDGYDYFYDDDSGAGFDPEILNYQVTQAGDYILVVSPYIPGDNGDITVIIDDLGTPSINDDVQLIRLSDKQRFAGAVFEAEAGETIRLSVRSVLSSGGEPRVTVQQGGEILASNSVGQVSRLLLEFTVEESGDVTVTVEDVNYVNAIIELSIERVE